MSFSGQAAGPRQKHTLPDKGEEMGGKTLTLLRSRLLIRGLFCLFMVLSLASPPVWAADNVAATWNGGLGFWNTAVNWDIDVVPNNSSDNYNVFVPQNTAVVNLDISPTINNLTIGSGAQVNIQNNYALGVSGSPGSASATITNNGQMSINSTGNYTDLILHIDTTLTGNGILMLGDSPNNRIYGTSGKTLTNDTNSTIQGAGQIGVGYIALDNKGTISANLNSANRLEISGALGVTNTGTMQASNGGFLRLSNGTFTNTGGLIQALTGSVVELNGAAINGGTLATSGSGIIQNLNTATLNGPIALNGTFTANNNTTTYIAGTFTNNGQMSITSTVNYTDLYLNDDTTLTGNGTLTLGDSPYNRIYGVSGKTLTNDTNHTIQGAGQIGVGYIGLDNKGTIVSNASNTLQIYPGSPGATNSGVMKATVGTLQLYGGTFTNTGMIQALNGTTVQMDGGAIVNNAGGTITTSGAGSTIEIKNGTVNGGTLTINTGGNLNVTGVATLNNLLNFTNSGTFTMANNSTTYTAGTFTNNGQMMLSSTVNFTNLYLNDDTTLTGNGTLTLGDSPNNRIYGISGKTLTNDTNHTIQGAGQIGVGYIGLDNKGTISANLNSANRLEVSAAVGVTNTGTMQASNSGFLRLSNGTFNNSGGLIQALTGSVVELNGATMNGGTLATSGSGIIQNLNAATLNGPIALNGTFVANNNITTYLAGTITNNGQMSINSTVNYTDVYLNDDTTLTGTGVLTFSDSPYNRIYGISGKMLTNDTNHTIQGAGQIGVGYIGLDNKGTISANASNMLQIYPGAPGATNSGVMQATVGTLQLYGGTFTNIGMIRALNGTTVQMAGGAVVNNAGGTITTSGAGSTIEIGNGTVNGGTLTINAGGNLNVTGVATLNNLLNFTNSGTFTMANNTRTYTAGTFTNNGQMMLSSTVNYTDLFLNDNTTLTGNGTFTLSDSPYNRIYGTTGMTLTNDTNHTIQGAGQIGAGYIGLDNKGTIIANAVSSLNIQTDNLFNNQGTLAVRPGSTMNVIGGYTQTSGLTSVAGAGILNAGTSAIGINGGILSGSGTVVGNVTVGPNGTVHPGNSPGVLTITGNYTNTGVLAIDILKLANTAMAGTDFSQLQVTGKAALGGTVQINLLPGATLAANEEIDILHSAGLNGTTFTSLTATDASLFTLVYSGTDVFLEATRNYTNPVPLPPSLLLLAPGFVGLAAIRRRFKK